MITSPPPSPDARSDAVVLIDHPETRAVRLHQVVLPDDLPIVADPDGVLDDHPIRQLHRHQCAEMGICVSGSGVFVVGEKVMEFTTGDVTFIDQSEAHLARSMPGTQSRWHWIYFDPMRLALASRFEHRLLDPAPLAGPGFRNVIHIEESPGLRAIVQGIVRELAEREPGFATNLVALTAQFMIMVRRARPDAGLDTADRSSASQFERIAPAVALIARGFADPLSIAELARACTMSQSSLRRSFHTAMGCSPRQYWTDLRLQMAASMLRSTEKSVAEVSEAVGFTTLSSFNRVFRDRFGQTPRVWRHTAG